MLVVVVLLLMIMLPLLIVLLIVLLLMMMAVVLLMKRKAMTISLSNTASTQLVCHQFNTCLGTKQASMLLWRPSTASCSLSRRTATAPSTRCHFFPG
jgi:hypothetical protein